MSVISIPKSLAGGGLVIIPQKEYREFSRWKRAIRVRLDERWFWTPEWQKKESEADDAIRAGRLTGPFSDAKSLVASLRRGK